MSRVVFCRKYQKELPGLARPPFPGKLGGDIFENISERAWKDWQSYQTMLINEKGLNMADAESRKFVQETMQKFFAGEEVATVEGYVPPDPSTT